MRYVIWFNGNNWESQSFMEVEDAAEFVSRFEERDDSNRYVWFITDTVGREILIDKEVVSL